MSYPGADVDNAARALRARGMAAHDSPLGNDLEVLRRAGFQGRRRWSLWNPDANCAEPQMWFPLWVIRVLVWLVPDEQPPATRAALVKARRDRLTVEVLRVLAHDRAARAAVQALAVTGRDQAVELLYLLAFRGMLRRHPREVWVGVCTSSVLGDGFNCRCTACSMDTTPDASAYSAHPNTGFEVRISELHPDDQELLDSGVPVVALDLFVGEEP